MPPNPGPLLRIVAPDDPVSAALATLATSVAGAPRVERCATFEEALSMQPAPEAVIVDEASLRAGDAALLKAFKRAHAVSILVIVEDGSGPGRGLVAAGAEPLLKPLGVEETLAAFARVVARSAAAEPAADVAQAANPELPWARGLADEIATPLATVSGHVQLFAAAGGNGPEGARLRAIQEGLERLRRTVDGLRAAGGARRPRAHRGDLTAIALERAASAPAVARMVCRSHAPVAALVDEAIAAQALGAVIDFALRATPGLVELWTGLDGADAVASVVIPAPTIPAESVPALFEPYAIDSPPSGLALAEARGLVRAHGGDARAGMRSGTLAIELRFPAAT
ncbi:MAG TPA: hypothetical protein VKE69_13110 [Planctomycetota bacterium]|nr:hypothetical protein [Planctomycetota bacterium]